MSRAAVRKQPRRTFVAACPTCKFTMEVVVIDGASRIGDFVFEPHEWRDPFTKLEGSCEGGRWKAEDVVAGTALPIGTFVGVSPDTSAPGARTVDPSALQPPDASDDRPDVVIGRRDGWQRVDPRPRSKCSARWEHPTGWALSHCGHMTALHPWELYDPHGYLHAAPDGRCWNRLELAWAYVAEQLRDPRPLFHCNAHLHFGHDDCLHMVRYQCEAEAIAAGWYNDFEQTNPWELQETWHRQSKEKSPPPTREQWEASRSHYWYCLPCKLRDWPPAKYPGMYASGVATPDTSPRCAWCEQPIPAEKVELARLKKQEAKYCKSRCRKDAYEARKLGELAETNAKPGTFGYFDPPYPGTAEKYYGDDPRCAEVDHRELLRQALDRKYVGFALSTSEQALPVVLQLLAELGVERRRYRICAWGKPGPVRARPTVARKDRHRGGSASNRTEYVIVVDGRMLPDVVPDFLHHAPARGGGEKLTGRKPRAFCAWVFQLLGTIAGDTLEDWYPGTRVVSRTWRALSPLNRVADVVLPENLNTPPGKPLVEIYAEAT